MNGKLIGMRLTYFLLSVILVIYGLIAAKEFLYPLAFGILLAYLLYPIVNFLEKKGMPRVFSILVPIIIALIVFVILAILVLKRISLFMDELPLFRKKTIAHIEDMQHYLESEYGVPAERFKNFLITRIFEIGTESEKIF